MKYAIAIATFYVFAFSDVSAQGIIGLSSESNTGQEPATTGLPTDVDIIIALDSLTGDQVYQDDLVVVGSIGVGFDATDGMEFGFETLILKENNVRIKFEDTSSSSQYPGMSWGLRANEVSNGGANQFAIDIFDYYSEFQDSIVNPDAFIFNGVTYNGYIVTTHLNHFSPFIVDGAAPDSAMVIGEDLSISTNIVLASDTLAIQFGDGSSMTSAPNHTALEFTVDSLKTVVADLIATVTSLSESVSAIPAGPAGPEGPEGPEGPAGPAGPTGATGGEHDLPTPATAGSMSFWDGSAWISVGPTDLFGTSNIGLNMCNGVPRWGPCVTITPPTATYGRKVHFRN